MIPVKTASGIVDFPSDMAVRIEDLSITYKVNVDTKRTLKNAVMRASKGEKKKCSTNRGIRDTP